MRKLSTYLEKRKDKFFYSTKQVAGRRKKKEIRKLSHVETCHTSFLSCLFKILAPQHEQLPSGRSSFKFSLVRDRQVEKHTDRKTGIRIDRVLFAAEYLIFFMGKSSEV